MLLRWNRVAAITGDCKSPAFWLRRFESYFQHQTMPPPYSGVLLYYEIVYKVLTVEYICVTIKLWMVQRCITLRSVHSASTELGDMSDVDYIEAFIVTDSRTQSQAGFLIDIVCPQPPSRRRGVTSASAISHQHPKLELQIRKGRGNNVTIATE